jgi:hypothetical protein
MRVPYQFAGRSAFFARTRGRFLRAQLLEEAGRDSEAYGWYASLAQGARMDYVFLAPSHLGRGRISERRGDHSQAAGHYRKALELWRDADPEVAAMREEARQGLARTEGR